MYLWHAPQHLLPAMLCITTAGHGMYHNSMYRRLCITMAMACITIAGYGMDHNGMYHKVYGTYHNTRCRLSSPNCRCHNGYMNQGAGLRL